MSDSKGKGAVRPPALLRPPRRLVPAVALCIMVAVLFACGGDDEQRKLLSQKSASRLDATLGQVAQRVSDGDCTGAGTQAAALRAQIDALPPRTSSKLRIALADSSEHLQSLVEQRCEPAAEATPEVTTPDPTVTDETPEENQGKKPKKSKPKDEEQPPPEDGGQGNQDGSGGTGLGNQIPPGQQDNSGGVTP
jgi:hypothetical protein